MTMLGLGSFPAADVSAFQMFQDQGGACGQQHQRSASPWTQTTALECFPDYLQMPVETSSRLSDQFTPQEYPTVTKLPPRQLQWVSSQAHGYNAAAALSYDVEAIQSGGLHPGQFQPVSATTSNGVWPSQFNQAVSQNLVSATADCPGPNQQAFHDHTTNYFVDCSLKQASNDAVCGTGPFTVGSSPPFPVCRPSHSDSYGVPTSSYFSGGSGVKSDPEGPADWPCSTLALVWHQSDCATTSPRQPKAGVRSASSPQSYASTVPYTPVPVDWPAVPEQKPTRITPSMSIGEPNTLLQ